jgi:type II secretory pathway pseudopilin PulG
MTPTRCRPSYTLLELMLVLAVIVMVSALAVPSIDGMYGYYKMNAAVDGVRGVWAQGLAHAQDEGVAYRFSVVPGKGNYRLAPDSSDFWSGGTPPVADPDNPPAVIDDSLPRGVTFAMGNNGPSPNVDSNAETSMPIGQVDSGSWSTVAVFLPDGTARDDVEILFQVKGARSKSIQLRALTGLDRVIEHE